MLLSTSARCTSPYRLQNRYSGLDFAFRYSVICSFRTFLGAVSPSGRHHVLPCSSALRNKWRPFAPPRVLRTKGPAWDQSLLRTPPTSVMARTASPFGGLCRRWSQVYPPCQISPFTRTSLRRHVVHADPAGPLSAPATVGLGADSSAFAQTRGARLPGLPFRGSFVVVHMFITTCRFDSMPAPHPASRRRSWHGLRC